MADNMIHGIGHNRGPAADEGTSWRRFAWTKAREALLPTLPIEVVRLRVKRAQELGLPYKTYAGVRASTGRDVIGFLFSNNALRAFKAGQGPARACIVTLKSLHGADRTALIHAPLDPALFTPALGLDAAHIAPAFTLPWPAMRDQIVGVIRGRGKPADGYLVIGATDFERDWAEAGRTAGFLSGQVYFCAAPTAQGPMHRV